jgi:F-type H+-transporting ATPase subunit delta
VASGSPVGRSTEASNHATGPSVRAVVTSAVPLTAKEKQAILQRLQGRFSELMEAEFIVDPAVVGGVRARVGDRLIDDTVAGKLSALREALLKSGGNC